MVSQNQTSPIDPLKGTTDDGIEWGTKEVTTADDLQFLKELLTTRPLKFSIEGKAIEKPQDLNDVSIEICEKAKPYSPLIGYLKSDNTKIGMTMLSREGGPGVATLRGCGAPNMCGKGFGKSGLEAMVKIYAPEVRRRGQTEEKFRIDGIPLTKLRAYVPQRAEKLFEDLGFKKVSSSNNNPSEEGTLYELVLSD